MTPSIKIRKAGEGDKAFVLATWLRSYYNGSQFGSEITPHVYFKWHHALCEAFWIRPTAYALIACNPDDENQIYGWAAMEQSLHGHLVHYVYVKPAFRQMGIAKALLPDSAAVSTHITRMAKRLFPSNYVYNPYLIGG